MIPRHHGWRQVAALALALHLTGCVTIGAVVATPTRGQTDAEIARDRQECEAEATEGRESGFWTFVKTKVGWTIAGAVLGLTLGVAAVAGGSERSYSNGLEPLILIGAAGAAGAGIGFVAASVGGVQAGLQTAARKQRSADILYRRCLRTRGYDVGG